MKPFLSKSLFGFLILIAFANLLNCSRFRSPSKAYTSLVEPLDNLDTSPLVGRRIVLDPGHGGAALGAVGYDGLNEKDINLQVAKRLQTLLKNAGATVVMTRFDDRDLITDRIDSLRGDDLDYRVRVSNREETDLFISLHHNSSLPLNREYSAIETYYKMEDFFSSKDAARLIHKHLVRNLQIPLNFLRPGNYYVLRNNTRTSVLGEASYISNPDIEKKLSKAESVEIEAGSYFLGILDYFSRGVPEITDIQPADEVTIKNSMPVFTIEIKEDIYGDGIDPQSILIGIDDENIPYTYEKPFIKAVPAKPLSNGAHKLYVNVANLKGNHSLLYESNFFVDLPPAHIIASHFPNSIPPDGETPAAITSRVLDFNFSPVKDGTPVRIMINDRPDSEVERYTKDGDAHFYVTFSDTGQIKYTVSSGSVQSDNMLTVKSSQSPSLHLTVVSLEKGPNKAIERALIGLDGERYGYTNYDGFVAFDGIKPGNSVYTVRKPGYYPASIDVAFTEFTSIVDTIGLEKMYGGLLFGKKIVIDPEFGGLTPGSIGPTGLRAADENMETARYLVNFLRTAGADAQLTIDQGDDLTPYSRVRFANEIGAHLFVSIRHASDARPESSGISTYAYPTSSNGKRLGTLALNSIAVVLGTRGVGPVEAADYVLQQTGCPALIVNLGNISNQSLEEELYTTRRNRLEAYSLFTALLAYFQGDNNDWGRFSGRIVDDSGKPVDNALISLDESLVIQSDPEGRFIFIALEPRHYSVKIKALGFENMNVTVTIGSTQKIDQDFTLSRKD